MIALRAGVALLLCAAGVRAGDAAWNPADLWNWHTPRDPRISPDGRRVVYLDEWNDRATDTVCANLVLVTVDGKQSRRLTDGAWRDRSPRWSPDGSRIAWISGRGGIHLIAVDSAQESVIDAAPLAIAWSADGQSIAFTSRLAAPAASAWAPPEILPWIAPSSHPGTTLFTVPASGGKTRAVSGVDFDAAGEPAWMRDGKSIAIASSSGQIYEIRLDDGRARSLTSGTDRNQDPLPSPDGSKIAWMSTGSALRSYSVRRLHVMNADGRREKMLAGTLDRDPVDPHWSSDSRTIYFLADDGGSTSVYASRNDSTVRQVTHGGERLQGFTLADNGRAVAVRTNADAAELVSFPADMPPPTATVLAAPMASLLAARENRRHGGNPRPLGRQIDSGVDRPPAAFRQRAQVSAAARYRRRSAPYVRARILARRADLRRARLGGAAGQPARHAGLRRGVRPSAAHPLSRRRCRRSARRGGFPRRQRRHRPRTHRGARWLAGRLAARSQRSLRGRGGAPADRRFRAGRPARRPMDGRVPMGRARPVRQTLASLFRIELEDDHARVLASAGDPQAEEFYQALEERKVKASLVRIPDWSKPSAQVLELETTLKWLSQ